MVRIRRQMKIWNEEERFLWRKGSITVESAFILPLFFFAITMIAGMLDLYHTTVLVQTALCEGAKELGMYAYCISGDRESPVGVVDDGICMAYGTRKVREVLKKESLPQIAGGIQGISLLGSAYEGDMVSLEAVFLYHMPADIFRSFPVRIKAEGAARAWVGYNGEKYGTGKSEEMVYVTEWEREKISMENLIINVTSAGAENLSAEMFISRKAEVTITAAVNAVGLPDM